MEVSVSTTDLADNDELFAGYAEQYIFGMGSGATTFAALSGDLLTDTEDKAVYTALKSKILSVAENGGSSQFTLDVTNMGVTYTVTENSGSGISGTYNVDVPKILDALLEDCPYELYWYDKEASTSYRTNDGFSTTLTAGDVVSLSTLCINFPVASAYQDSTAATPSYAVSATGVATAKTAKANADSVVTAALKEGSVYNQLLYCLNYIKTNVAYGNPSSTDKNTWQMIWAFDGNSTTNVVCEGYAKAFKYLCDGIGVECYTVSGTMGGGTGAGAHMWNIVVLDENSYLVAPTNCDGDGTTNTVGYPDKLFLKAPTNGSGTTEAPYTFSDASNITYVYDTSTTDMLGNSGILTLATKSYEVPVTYTVTIADTMENGSVTANLNNAEAGTTVTLTVSPAYGYELDTLTVKQGETAVTVSDTYTFTMPAGNVTVDATFKAVVASVETYDIWVQGVQVTSANKDDVLGDADEGATVVFTPAAADDDTSTPDVDERAAGVLTLNGAAISLTGDGAENAVAAIESKLPYDLEIRVLGTENKISASGGINNAGIAVNSDYDLTFRGEKGSELTITAGAPGTNGVSYAVSHENGTCEFEGGTVTLSGYTEAVVSNSISRDSNSTTIALGDKDNVSGSAAVEISDTVLTSYVDGMKYLQVGDYELYPLYVGGKQVTERNKGNVLGDSGTPTVVFTPADGTNPTNTLVLSNATITGTADVNYGAGVYVCPEEEHFDLTISYSGTNTIRGASLIDKDASFGTAAAVYVAYEGNDLTITGSGSLEITGGEANFAVSADSTGVSLEGGNLTIEDADRLTIRGGKTNAEASSGSGYIASSSTGVYVSVPTYGITVTDSSVTFASGDTLVAGVVPDDDNLVSRLAYNNGLTPILSGCYVSEVHDKDGMKTTYDPEQSYSSVEIRAGESYGIRVGGTLVTSSNATDVLGNGTVSYDKNTATLTLSGAEISSNVQYDGVYVDPTATFANNTFTIDTTADSSVEGGHHGVNSPGEAKLVLEGDGKFSVTSTSGYCAILADHLTVSGEVEATANDPGTSGYSISFGVRVNDLTVSSDGKLTATSADFTNFTGDGSDDTESIGVYVEGDVTVAGTITGSAQAAYERSCGVYSNAPILVRTGGKLEGTSQTSADSTGVHVAGDDPYATVITVQTGGELIGTAEGLSYNSVGVRAGEDVIVAGTLTATGDDSREDTYGLGSYGTVTVKSGGKLVGSASNAQDSSFGVAAQDAITVEAGGTLEASANVSKDSSNSNGVYTPGEIAVSGSLNAVATGSDTAAYAIRSTGGGLSVTGASATLTAEGDYAAVSAYTGVYIDKASGLAIMLPIDGYADDYSVFDVEDNIATIVVIGVPTSIVGATVTMDSNGLTYDGTPKKPTPTRVTILQDGAEVELTTSDYDIAGYSENINAGTATITIEGKGYYTGTATGSFTIAKKDITDAEIVLGDALTHNGTEQTQSVSSVTVIGQKLDAESYEVTGNTATDAGTYTLTVTITDHKNFTGSATKEYVISKIQLPAPAPEDGKIFKVEMEVGISEVPEGLKALPNLDTPEEINLQMKTVISAKNGSIPQNNVAVYDVTLMYSIDGGETWIKADEEHFPDNGLTVQLPYPKGTGKDSHNFTVAHMFTSSAFGKVPGDVEYPAVTKTAEGIAFKVTGLSPISVGWEEVKQNEDNGSDDGNQTQEPAKTPDRTPSEPEPTPKPQNVKSPATIDNSNVEWCLFTMLVAGAGLISILIQEKRKRNETINQ